MNPRTKAAVRLSLWVGFLTAAYLFLHSLAIRLPVPAPSSFSDWTLNTSNVVMALTMLRIVLMAVVIYLAFALLLALLAELTHLGLLQSACRIAGVGTKQLVRNALGISLAVAVATPALGGVASAAPQNPPVPVLHHVAAGEKIQTPVTAPIFVETEIPTPTHEGTVLTAPVPAETDTWTAIRGDNLWMIARRTLINRGLRHSNVDVHDYLQVLVNANREQLTHGTPDLIFPGQVFVLPKN